MKQGFKGNKFMIERHKFYYREIALFIPHMLYFYSLSIPSTSLCFFPSPIPPLSFIVSPPLCSQSFSLPVWQFWDPLWLVLPQCVVVFCLWELSCAMLLCPGPEPFPIVCCHMEVSTNMEISLSSCCSLTFSGTQLALNAEIIIIPII